MKVSLTLNDQVSNINQVQFTNIDSKDQKIKEVSFMHNGKVVTEAKRIAPKLNKLFSESLENGKEIKINSITVKGDKVELDFELITKSKYYSFKDIMSA
jgi:archaellum component FlaF (FlaF/FlaG flagellin family)